VRAISLAFRTLCGRLAVPRGYVGRQGWHGRQAFARPREESKESAGRHSSSGLVASAVGHPGHCRQRSLVVDRHRLWSIELDLYCVIDAAEPAPLMGLGMAIMAIVGLTAPGLWPGRTCAPGMTPRWSAVCRWDRGVLTDASPRRFDRSRASSFDKDPPTLTGPDLLW